MTNYGSNDYKSATPTNTMFATKSNHNHQPINPFHGVHHMYNDKVTGASTALKSTERDAMTESKSMNNSNYSADANFSNVMTATSTASSSSSASSNVKLGQMIKSEKVKSYSESGNKNECIESGRTNENTGGGGAMNQMNLVGSHQTSSSCYSTAMDSVGVEPSMNTDDLCYRNYTNTNDLSRSSASFANDMMANRALVANYEYSAVRSYETAMNGIPSGPAFDRYDMNLGNLYASSLSMPRSNLTYPSYLNTFGADDPNQQKYLHDHHFTQTAMLKNDSGSENATPYYPKPMYHYDPAFPLAGFSAMNLSLRTAAAAAAAAGTTLPIMELSSSATTANLHSSNSPHYSSVQRLQINSASPTKSVRTPNSTPPSATTAAANETENNRLNNLKMQSYQLHGENFAQNSRSPQNEPVDLCNSPIKQGFGADNSMETAQNRPFSRESTSDSNASPYVDAYKGEPMGKFLYKRLLFTFRKIEKKKRTQIIHNKRHFFSHCK